MFNSAIMEVAIGLIFVYVLLSLVCSALSEIIAQLLKLRSKTLKEGIQRLLTDETIRRKVYNHPLIKSLSKKIGEDQLPSPSYIPARNFALALFDAVAPAGERAGGNADPNDPSKNKPIYAAACDFNQIREKIADLPEGEIRTALLSLFDSAKDNLEQARKNVEDWFDGAMERVSGWYKRKSQWILLGVAFIVACIINVDTLSLSTSLWQNPTLRQEITVAADLYISRTQSITGHEKPEEIREAWDNLQNQLSNVKKLDLPLGWSWTAFPQKGSQWCWKIIGLVITTLAVSLGAPFWFDLLNKVARLRVSGVVPRKSGETK